MTIFNIYDSLHPIVLIFYWINFAMILLFFILYLNQHVHTFISIFTRRKKWKEAKVNHKFGFIISGRNEEKVIGNLIDSIKEMDYPQDKIDIFVCADNCTDNTSEIARDKGAIVFERNDLNNIGKSYALDFLFKKIKSDSTYDDVEAFLIMDADNLVSKNYLKEMNKTFDAGVEVATSYRQSKNFDASWVSSCSSIAFYRECSIVHHSRQKLNLGTYVSGTGFFLSRRILDMIEEWQFHTMTEDIEFSIWCATHNILISYNENAMFYDEQPDKLKIANKQRLRWCKGTNQCCVKYDKDLIKGMFKGHKKLTCFGLFIHVTPIPVITVLWLLSYLILNLIFMLCNFESVKFFSYEVFNNVFGFLLFIIVISILHATISLIKNRNYMKNYSLLSKVKGALLFPFFVSMYIHLSLEAMFKKDLTWESIPHNDIKSIETFEK